MATTKAKGKKDEGGEDRGSGAEDWRCPLERLWRAFRPGGGEAPPDFVKHFIQAEVEVLEGIKGIIDWRVEQLEKAAGGSSGKGFTRITVED